jgi:hypothetical protein
MNFATLAADLNHNQILTRINENEIEIEGVTMANETFVQRMGALCFDMEFTARGINLLRVGGVWALNLSPFQVRVVTNNNNRRQGGRGFS